MAAPVEVHGLFQRLAIHMADLQCIPPRAEAVEYKIAFFIGNDLAVEFYDDNGGRQQFILGIGIFHMAGEPQLALLRKTFARNE